MNPARLVLAYFRDPGAPKVLGGVRFSAWGQYILRYNLEVVTCRPSFFFFVFFLDLTRAGDYYRNIGLTRFSFRLVCKRCFPKEERKCPSKRFGPKGTIRLSGWLASSIFRRAFPDGWQGWLLVFFDGVVFVCAVTRCGVCAPRAQEGGGERAFVCHTCMANSGLEEKRGGRVQSHYTAGCGRGDRCLACVQSIQSWGVVILMKLKGDRYE